MKLSLNVEPSILNLHEIVLSKRATNMNWQKRMYAVGEIEFGVC